ncbi:MAG: PilW family protein [Pseudomonadota bacterium]
MNRQMNGMTLIEILIAMSIGIILLGAVVQTMVLHNQAFRQSEALALLQEQAAVAHRMLRDDIVMSGHWGNARTGHEIDGASTPSDDNPQSLRVPSRCPARMTLNIAQSLEMDKPDDWRCDLDATPDNDGLVVRYASSDHHRAQANKIQLASNGITHRLQTTGAHIPADATPPQYRDVEVRAFYVAPSSSLFPEQPVLRRLTLSALSSRPIFIDEEITAGIERFLVRLAVDTNNDDVPDTWISADDARASRTDDAGRPLLRAYAVELNLVTRSESPIWKKTRTTPLVIGGRRWQPPSDGYLRIATRTVVALRNNSQT